MNGMGLFCDRKVSILTSCSIENGLLKDIRFFKEFLREPSREPGLEVTHCKTEYPENIPIISHTIMPLVY